LYSPLFFSMKTFFKLGIQFLFFVGFAFVFSTKAEALTTITPLTVKNQLSEAREQAPITWSVPLSRGENIKSVDGLALYEGNTRISAQFTVMSRWGGVPTDATKPIMWVLVDTQVDLAANERLTLNLVSGANGGSAGDLSVVQNSADKIIVDTGAARYTISKTNFKFFDSVELDNGVTYAGNGGIYFGGALKANPATITVEHTGPERISLKAKGTIQGGLKFTSRMHFYKNLSEVKVDFRVENLNPTPTSEFGQPQANNYGSVNSVNFDDLSIVIPAGQDKTYRIPTGELGVNGETSGSYDTSVVVVQNSSGDANWNIMKGKDYDQRLQSAALSRASSIKVDGSTQSGPNQIAGWFDANNVTVAVERAWQNYPKAFRATGDMVEIGLFPGEYPNNHELRAGEFKTHTFWVRHHDGADVGARARSFLSPLRLLPSASYIGYTQAAGYFTPRVDTDFAQYEKGMDYMVTRAPDFDTNVNASESGATSIFDTISKGQLYGWVDYGDIPTDFEKTWVGNTSLNFFPYNWKYDGLRGTILQALRNGENEKWWELASSGARHVADIDIHHSDARGCSGSRPWFEGGMYGHGYHNEDARENPHRNLMNPSTSMAGPGPGLILYALLTGDTLVLDSGLELADNLCWKSTHSNYDSDANSSFIGGAEIAREVGLQKCTGSDCSGYESADGGRIGGNLVGTMVMAYMATGKNEYFDVISKLSNYLQRYETEKLAGQQSCDRHHFQTTFIRSLGQYLLLRENLGLAVDTPARNLLSRRMDYMTGSLWSTTNKRMYMCYDGGAIRSDAYDNNWQLGAADALAVGGLVLDKPILINTYAKQAFDFGSKNHAWSGSPLRYNSTKEFVNQVGFGNMFLFAYDQVNNKGYNKKIGGATVTPEEDTPVNSAGCALQRDTAYKTANSSAVYYVDLDCKKRPFKNSFIFFTYFDSWSQVKVTTLANLSRVPNHELGFMPFGPKYDPKYGALVKTVTDPKVYFLLNGKKYWVTSESVFLALGYKWNWVEDIDPRLLDKYPNGGEITNTKKHLDGTIVKYADSSEVYLLDGGKKRHIADEETFNSLGYRWDRIVTLPDSETYSTGEEKTLYEPIRLIAR